PPALRHAPSPHTTLFRSTLVSSSPLEGSQRGAVPGRAGGRRVVITPRGIATSPAAARRPPMAVVITPRGIATATARRVAGRGPRSEEHTSELQSRENLVC